MSRIVRALCAMFLTVVASSSFAAEYKSELDQKIKASQDVGALGVNLAGDHVNYYTGSTGFSNTDISLPGNGMGLSLSRSYAVEQEHQLAAVKGTVYGPKEIFSTRSRLFGNWDLDVPSISTVMTQSSGWIVDSSTPTKRCSVVGQTGGSGWTLPGSPPPATVAGFSFSPEKYWSGYTLHAGGDQSLLAATVPNNERPSTGGPYHWTTNKDWWVSCLSTLAGPLTSGQPPAGEGYLAISPNGTKYWFNWLSKRNVTSVWDRGEQDPAGYGYLRFYYLFRAEYTMLPTRVEDRFGNWTTYSWTDNGAGFARLNSVSTGFAPVGANPPVTDQTITLLYNAQGFVDTASDGARTWTYHYTGSSLTEVILPDASKWTYNFSNTDNIAAYSPTCPLSSYTYGTPEYYWDCFGNGGYDGFPGYPAGGASGISVTHPSGAQVSFDFAYFYEFSGGETGIYPLGLLQKTISGPGIPTATWKVSQYPDKATAKAACQANACPTTRYTDVLAPDGSIKRNIFGTSPESGMLLSELSGSTVPGTGGGSPPVTASARWGTTPITVASPTTGTVPTFYQEVESRYVQPTDATAYTVKVGSNPLSGANEVPVDTFAAERRIPLAISTQYLQGAQFKSEIPADCAGVRCFNAYAQPTRRIASSTGATGGNFSRTETTTYQNDPAKWVLGLTLTSGCINSTDCGGTSGRVTKRTDYDPVTLLPWKVFGFDQVNPEATLTYNTNGTLATAKDARGFTTSLNGYTRGTPGSIQLPDSTSITGDIGPYGQVRSVTDQLGSKSCYGYDAMFRLLSITYTAESAGGLCDTSAWNGTLTPFEYVTTAEYGIPANHWRRTTTTGYGQSITYYDAMWRPVLTKNWDTQNAASLSFVVNRYDGAGHKIFTSYPVGALTSVDDTLDGVWTEYDALGRVTKVSQDSEQVAPYNSTKTEYLAGFETRVTNPRQIPTTTTRYQTYDSPSTDSPVLIVLPEGVTTTIVRQPALAKPLTVTRSGTYGGTGLSLTRAYVYDSNERLCQTINPESATTIVDYDLSGNVLWSAEGQTATGTTATSCAADRLATSTAVMTTRAIDSMNRVTQLTTPGHVADITTGYAADGLPISLLTKQPGTDTVTNTYTYNRRRLLTRETVQVNANAAWGFDYAYNANGHMSSQTYPGSLLVGYAPDALGRPTQAGTFANTITYYPNGAMSGFNYGNGIVHSMIQNRRKLPIRSVDANGATAVLDDTYAYDPNGNVLSMVDNSNAPTIDNRTWGAMAPTVYDGLDRLVSARSTNQWGSPQAGSNYNATYSYDPLDNIRTASLGASSYTYAYDLGIGSTYTNRLKSINNGVTAYAFGSDTLGRMTSSALKNQSYQFDVANRMTAVTGKESYLYDGNGRRARTLNATTGTIEYFGYGLDGRLLQDWSNRRNVRNAYVYLGNTLVGLYEVTLSTGATASKYKHTDALGSPVVTTDLNKVVLNRSAYTPYGVPVAPVDGVGYTGHFIDVGTQLTYMQQRYYDPQIGRFLTVDPAASEFNRYSYASNNSLRFIDPDGRLAGDGLCDSGASGCDRTWGQSSESSTEDRVGAAVAKDWGHARHTFGGGGAGGGGASGSSAWSDLDLFAHHVGGTGRDVSLSEIGLRNAIYYSPAAQTAMANFGDQIGGVARTDASRISTGGSTAVYDWFTRAYDFSSVRWAIGSATLSGTFAGRAYKMPGTGKSFVTGEAHISFHDYFHDTFDVANKFPGELNAPRSKNYNIRDSWTRTYTIFW